MNERPDIDLEIHGKGLLLSGVFGAWQSRLVLGPDLDDVGVNLFVDSTSVRVDPNVDHKADASAGPPLFSFRSRDVFPLGQGQYRVVGDFTGANVTRPLELDVETPLGHTPHIVLSFTAEKKDFGANWNSLVENATLFGKGDEEGQGPHREAVGWLTTPVVAAA
jgi:polyisoprenoid-binding protein YceI